MEEKPGLGFVVWKKFRHKLEMLTPFALFAESRTDSSLSPYMIYTQEDFDSLLEQSRGVLSRDLKVKVEPLFKKFKDIELKPVRGPFGRFCVYMHHTYPLNVKLPN